MKKIILILLIIILCNRTIAQVNNRNEGTEFWVGYPLHQFMSIANTQNLSLYISVSRLPVGVNYATVTITIDSSGATSATNWKRVYQIARNSTIDISSCATPAISAFPATGNNCGPMPKGTIDATQSNTNPNYDCRLFSDPPPSGTGSQGIFRKKGIHIESDYPISINSHIYGQTSSGGTLLLPVSACGNQYRIINSRQSGIQNSSNFFFVMATKDSTPIKVTPSQGSLLGNSANVPINVLLNKGQIYQYVGTVDAVGNGVQLTGSLVESLNPNKPIVVFAGSARTSGEDINCGTSGGRDNDFQQCFPFYSWGLQFATVPFAQYNGSIPTATGFSTCAYKIVTKDTGTIVTCNGVPLTLSNPNALSSFYFIANNQPSFIKSNKPIAIAQFMTGTQCAGTSGVYGDPEIVYLTPLENSINKAVFYRTTVEGIVMNYLNICVPDSGMNSLKIDGSIVNSSTPNIYITNHTNLPGYKTVTKGWAASKSQSVVECNMPFTGITYGVGAAESYAFNLGMKLDALQVPNYNPFISGKIYYDYNKNNIKDSSDINAAFVPVKLSNGTTLYTDFNGYYFTAVDSLGSYSLSVQPPTFYTAVPNTTTYTFSSYDTTVFQNIALQTNVVKDSLFSKYSIYDRARPNTKNIIGGLLHNAGTTIMNVLVNIKVDSTKMKYISALDTTTIIHKSIGTVNQSYINLKPGQYTHNLLAFRVDTTVVAGDTIRATVTTNANGNLKTDSLRTLVIASFDPNNKIAVPTVHINKILNGDYLGYRINFQNTGNDTAFNIIIQDTLSPQLQPNTLEVLGTSHNANISLVENRLTFRFNNILLPDSNVNNLLSNGFIDFRIKPQTNLLVGDSITNKVSIYFDYNKPVVTNTATTKVVNENILPLSFLQFNVESIPLENEYKAKLLWNTANEVNVSYFNIQKSENGKDFLQLEKVNAINKSYNTYVLTDNIKRTEKSKTWYYRIEAIDKDGGKTYSTIQHITISPQLQNILVYPNPTKDFVTVSSTEKISFIRIVDLVGKNISINKNNIINSSTNSVTFKLSHLQPGIYVMQIQTINGKISNNKIVVK